GQMKTRHFAAILLVLCILAATVLAIAFIASMNKRSVVLSEVDFPPLRFHIKSRNINGIMGVAVFSKTKHELLWHVSMGTQNIEEITYGVVPPRSEQLFPVGRPRDINEGEIIYVSVSYQFDEFLSPSGSMAIWELKLKGTGERSSAESH